MLGTWIAIVVTFIALIATYVLCVLAIKPIIRDIAHNTRWFCKDYDELTNEAIKNLTWREHVIIRNNKIMTQNEKDLLLKDLCARLPHGVKISDGEGDTVNVVGVYRDTIIIPYAGITKTIQIDGCKPYLFPLSSMTEEQKKELDMYFDIDNKFLIEGYKNGLKCAHPYFNVQDWYNKNHFDYRGLIPMGLAIDATGKNIY